MGVETTVAEYHGYDDYMNLQVLKRLSSYVSDEDMFLEEEDKIRSEDGKDLAIFRNIDATFFDDSLLVNMQEALTQQPLPLLKMLRFVVTVVDCRLGFSLSDRTRVTEYDRRRERWPWTLSRHTRVILINLLTESMLYELNHRSSLTWEMWTKYSKEDSEWSTAFILLTSLSSIEAIPDSVLSLFHKFNSGWGPFEVFLYQMRTVSRYDPEWPARSLLLLAQSLKTLKAEDAESTLRYVSHVIFLDRTESSPLRTYRRLLRLAECELSAGYVRVIIPSIPQTIIALLEVARIILHNYILEQTQTRDQFPEDMGDLLEFVFDVIPVVKKHVSSVDFDKPLTPASDGPCLNRLLTDLFTTPSTTGTFLNFLFKRSHLIAPEHPEVITSLLKRTIDRTRESPTAVKDEITLTIILEDDDIAILNACTTFFVTQPSVTRSNSLVHADLPVLVLLRLCRLIWSFYTFTDIGIVAYWERLFTAVHECYERIMQDRRYHYAGRLTCRYSSTNEHSATCETAYAILSWVTFFRRVRYTNDMVKFFRSFHLEESEKRTTAASTTNSPLRSSLEEQKRSPGRAKPFHPVVTADTFGTSTDGGTDKGAHSQLSPDAHEASRYTVSPQQETANGSSVPRLLPTLIDHNLGEPEGHGTGLAEPATMIKFENEAAVEGTGGVRATTPRGRSPVRSPADFDRNPMEITKEGIPSPSDPHLPASIPSHAVDMADAGTSHPVEDSPPSIRALSLALALSNDRDFAEAHVRWKTSTELLKIV
ncbi:hypothetical protein EIP86_006550 [Pleurotus ostreatoroseus]|nr:hypothetical protein EIP86_006550 [Pleurotus ostreatoroseus]